MLEQTRIGRLSVGIQGFGAMGISEFYGPTDERKARLALEKALDLGVTYFDTADIYGAGHNEAFLSSFLASHREDIVVGTKFGVVRDPHNPVSRGVDNTEEHIRRSIDASLIRLGVDQIDLYYMHRKDPNIPITETVGVLANLVAQGKIREIGLSEVTAAELKDAHSIHPIAAVQTEWSLFSRDAERFVIPQASELGIAVVAYAPLSRGLLTGGYEPTSVETPDDSRGNMPRFRNKNLRRNQDLLEPICKIGKSKNASIAQIALAWVHSRARHHSLNVVPIPGTRDPGRVVENVSAAELELSESELAVLSSLASEVAGDRYPDLAFTYLEREAATSRSE